MQPATYKYLTDKDLSLQTIWSWAKQLVLSLVKRDAELMAYSVPVGTSTTYRGAVPTGWLRENGASVLKESYPGLFAVIGYTYGGSGANFTLPNSGANTAIKY